MYMIGIISYCATESQQAKQHFQKHDNFVFISFVSNTLFN